MKTLRIILILLGLGAAFAGGYGYRRWYATGTSDKGGRKILYYVDAMHPWYKSDKPGIAPDCGMKLEPVYADSGSPATAQQERKILRYQDPKNPKYTSDKPGINPETGNDLEPVYAADASTIPPGALEVSADRQQLIGVRYGVVSYEASGQEIRSVGRVAVDETKLTRVHARVDGWIERVHADFVGQLVGKGEPLLTLYSPEILATQQELLLALKAKDIMSKSSMHEAHENSDAMVAAARRRLELWNFDRTQIESIEKAGKPVPSITIVAPATGFITTRNAFPGQKIMPDTELYAVADLSRVWVMADVFESDGPAIRTGVNATVSSANDPTLRIQARVSYIQPLVDPATRTLKVRLELNNPGYKLKPDMFVDVTFQVGGQQRLSVPAEAVLDAGTTKTVFVDRSNGFLEPRHVETGLRMGDRIEILRGLQKRERIVVSGAFLLNSESQLKSAMSGMTHDSAASAKPDAPAKAAPHKGSSHD